METALPIITIKQKQRSIICSAPAMVRQANPNGIYVLLKLPVDIEYRLQVLEQQLDIVTMFSILLDGIDVHIDRSTNTPTYQAAAGLAKLNLENWQRAIAWCMQLHLKKPLNMKPFIHMEYQAMYMFGDYVHKKFEFISSLFQAFELIDAPAPFQKNGFAEIFLWAIIEDINRDNQCSDKTEKKLIKTSRQEVAALEKKQNIYSEDFLTNHLIFQTAFVVMERKRTDSNKVKNARSRVIKAFDAMTKALGDWHTNWRDDPDRYGFCRAYVKNGQIFVPQKRTKGKPAIQKLTNIPKDKIYG